MRLMFTPAVAAAVLMACSPGGSDRRSGEEADRSPETGMAADTATSGTPTGENAPSLGGILSRLELANTAEIQTSKLGASQARSPAVKKLAQQLVTEHTKNRAELEALAGKKGVDVLPPAGGNTARDTAGVLALKGLEGAEFDRAFVKAQIEAHQANLDAIRTQMLPAAQDADVRQFLEKTQGAMQQHLTSLQRVQSQLES